MPPHLTPPQNGPKPSSRFTGLNVFKLRPGSTNDVAPPPPPKDSPSPSLSPPSSAFYNKSLFSRSAASLVPSLSPESVSGPATPASPFPPIPSAGFESGKRSNGAFQGANGRAAAPSPAPSASGGSLRSFGRSAGDCLASPSMDGFTDSGGSCPNVNANFDDTYLLNGAAPSAHAIGRVSSAGTKPRKGVFKLAGLAKKNKSKKDLSDTASASGSVSRSTSVSEQDSLSENVDGDEGISTPWNFQHNIHVDEGYIGLPPSWSSALSQVGFNEDEIAAIHARRRAAAIAAAPNTKLPNLYTANPTDRSASPHGLTAMLPVTSTSASNILLEPVPRSTSLRKGYDALAVHPPSVYSVATSTDGGPPSLTGRTSPTPSPRAPPFSVKSLVGGIKSSLKSDSASSSSRGKNAIGEELEQFVFVNGNGPDEGGGHGMGDETVIDPYPFDTSSVSSHQTHIPRMRLLSQGQQTPRTPTFPQIQVQRAQSDAGHISFPSSTSSVPSPLACSTSLPISTPSRGHAYPNNSAFSPPSRSLDSAGLRPGSASAPPRTPPKRIYHVTNPSSDSYDGTNYSEPPPAYASPKREVSVAKKGREGFGILGGLPPPNRPIPLVPTEESVGEPPGLNNHDSREEDQEVPVPDTTALLTDNIPGTADEVLDTPTHRSDSSADGEDANFDPVQQVRLSSPTPPLGIDKRIAKLATLPPRISLLQEGSLEDWSESLFREIGGNGKRSSILAGPSDGVASNVKRERRTAIRPMSPLYVTGGDTSSTALNSLQLDKAVPPSPSDFSFGANLMLGPQARGTTDAVEEGDEQEQEVSGVSESDAGETAVDVNATTLAEEEAKDEVKEVDELPVDPSIPALPDVSLGAGVKSPGEDLHPPALLPSSQPESPRSDSVDSLPPSPPPKPKPKPKPTPLVLPSPIALVPPRTSIITGMSGKSPVNSPFGTKPQPLPVPIPPAQIRAQLRPPPPKPLHPPPTLPLPPPRRFPSQPNLPSLSPAQSPLLPIPSPRKPFKHGSTASQASPMDSRPNSSQTLLPIRGNGDRDSSLSTITVTPATIATAKTEVVRTAVASVIDSDAVSLASKRESVVSTADAEPQTLAHCPPDADEESRRTQEREEAPDDSLASETSSVSLLRAHSQSKWPTPPPPPVEFGTDTTPRRLSRFRTTSLGRVTQLQAMGSQATSPSSSHSSHGSSETTSSSTSESAPLTTPRGVNGLPPSTVPKAKGFLAAEARLLSSTTDTFGGVEVEGESGEKDDVRPHPSETLPESTTPCTHPLLTQLRPYLSPRTPSSSFANLVEIAEGESGSVFAARVVPSSHGKQQDSTERPIPPDMSHVAIKRIPLPPAASSLSLSDDSPVSNKLVSVLHELSLLKNLDHEHLLLLDGIYVDSDPTDAESASVVDTSLWIQMELMERSLADVIGLVAEGLVLQERLIARFASDILHGLDYLQRQHIAHRDVRSDNLLVNASGVVKIADFSNAIRVDRNAPTVTGVVGVIYWQAPEMRAGPYNALKVDIWSLGATVWELAETIPPFSTPASPSTQVSFALQATRKIGPQWPPLSHPEHYSRPFHEFLRLCGRESEERPGPGELLNTALIRNACGRPVILQLLSQCRSIEEAIAAKEAPAGQS